DIHPPSLTKIRHTLVLSGLVVDSTRRELTRRGRPAIVWRLARPAELEQHAAEVTPWPRPAPAEEPDVDEDLVDEVDTEEVGPEAAPLDDLAVLAPVASGSTVARRLAEARARLAG